MREKRAAGRNNTLSSWCRARKKAGGNGDMNNRNEN